MMMATFYNPNGNPEVWNTKPDGYYTPEEWAKLHPYTPPEKTFEEALTDKLAELSFAFDNRVRGAFKTTQNFIMQFDTSDSIKMQGAIQLLEATDATEGYLTQADDTTVYHVPLDTMKTVLIEMMTAFASCHARKQELRAAIKSAETVEDLDAIEITWPL